MTRLLVIFFSIVISSWTPAPDKKFYENYRKAIKNESTFQYFVVINLTDLNTGQKREICTQGNFLHGALHREYNLGYDDNSINRVHRIALSNRTRAFKFKSVDAILNLGTDLYSMDELKQFEERNNIDDLAKEINKDWKKRLDDKEMMLFAHSLFNRGILTGENNCFGGTLEVVVE